MIPVIHKPTEKTNKGQVIPSQSSNNNREQTIQVPDKPEYSFPPSCLKSPPKDPGGTPKKGGLYKVNIKYINKLVALTQNNDEDQSDLEAELDELLYKKIETPLKALKQKMREK